MYWVPLGEEVLQSSADRILYLCVSYSAPFFRAGVAQGRIAVLASIAIDWDGCCRSQLEFVEQLEFHVERPVARLVSKASSVRM